MFWGISQQQKPVSLGQRPAPRAGHIRQARLGAGDSGAGLSVGEPNGAAGIVAGAAPIDFAQWPGPARNVPELLCAGGLGRVGEHNSLTHPFVCWGPSPANRPPPLAQPLAPAEGKRDGCHGWPRQLSQSRCFSWLPLAPGSLPWPPCAVEWATPFARFHKNGPRPWFLRGFHMVEKLGPARCASADEEWPGIERPGFCRQSVDKGVKRKM